MVRDTSSGLISSEQFTDAIGFSLPGSELSRCLKQVQYHEPAVGQFWQTIGH
ncbi:MAG: hypothetical protein AAFR37_06790 [Cyanobacteria bacterium J06628_3]